MSSWIIYVIAMFGTGHFQNTSQKLYCFQPAFLKQVDISDIQHYLVKYFNLVTYNN